MTTHHPRRIAAATLTITGLLLAACSSSGSPTHTTSNSTHSAGGAARPSGATGAAATPLAATSSTPHTSAAAHPVAGGSACTLITEKDITAKVGTDPGKGSADESPRASQCKYGNYQTQILLVDVVRSQGTADYHHARTDPKLTRAPGTSLVNVSGLGDQAFELPAPTPTPSTSPRATR